MVSLTSQGMREEASLLSPATFFTKICMVSSAAADEAEEVEETEEMLLERMLAVAAGAAVLMARAGLVAVPSCLDVAWMDSEV